MKAPPKPPVRRGAQDPICRFCVSYFVTWEPQLPHGCRALGFKSRQLPSLEVRRTSGEPCRYFTPARRG
ncbi:MAG: uracil-DNA glycosylase [Deltaproteobacteria bacterium]|nr:uracil-DNA glycosylase [Deltaproteobacteria bacterium]